MPRFVLLILVVVAVLSGCSKKQPSPQQQQEAEVEANPERDKTIKAKLNEFGRENFPDDADVTWKHLETVHKGKYSFVTAEPSPQTVGYSKVKFVILFAKKKEPKVVGCYCFTNGRFELLFDDPKAPIDWKKLHP